MSGAECTSQAKRMQTSDSPFDSVSSVMKHISEIESEQESTGYSSYSVTDGQAPHVDLQQQPAPSAGHHSEAILLVQKVHAEHLQKIDSICLKLEERLIKTVQMSIAQEVHKCFTDNSLNHPHHNTRRSIHEATIQDTITTNKFPEVVQFPGMPFENETATPTCSQSEHQPRSSSDFIEEGSTHQHSTHYKKPKTKRMSSKKSQLLDNLEKLEQQEPQELKDFESSEYKKRVLSGQTSQDELEKKSKYAAKLQKAAKTSQASQAFTDAVPVKDLTNETKEMQKQMKKAKSVIGLDSSRGAVDSDNMGVIQARVAQFAQSSFMETIMLIIILSNTVYMAWETDWVARNLQLTESSMPWVRGVELFFTIVFCVDLALRIFVERKAFIKGKNSTWNALDSFVVAMALVEEALLAFSSGSSVLSSTKVIRVLRILRIIRILRLIRGASLFTELRAICMGIWHTLGSLVWAIVLLLLIIFIFAVYLTQGVSSYLIDTEPYQSDVYLEACVDDDLRQSLRTNFGSLLLTMYSLWKAITGGNDWENFGDPLFEVSYATGTVFLMYMCFAICAMFNVVTGIFVNKAVKVIEGDVDLKLLDHTDSRKEHIDAVKRVFEKADTDGSGTLSRQEFREHFDNPVVQAFFASLDLDLEGVGVNQLFDLLNYDKDNLISYNEFIFGCSSMKGYARNLDLARLSSAVYGNHKEMKEIVKNIQLDSKSSVSEAYTSQHTQASQNTLLV
eukprot:gnl/MRDRNA2_/MRDRNA2_126955_c0_seq1.p1 gnl/MRDRNA2_/MRDRNA2_126955_c0~~gnl/MRDRNA2_/MRDRNA2_126955_c0_seq1.p1  ORF type:complete len:732 (+),score=122.55 gnl/MRDRNA2_/MRDRNA2_126955_c0_seq1:109-2304(+)